MLLFSLPLFIHSLISSYSSRGQWIPCFCHERRSIMFRNPFGFYRLPNGFRTRLPNEFRTRLASGFSRLGFCKERKYGVLGAVAGIYGVFSGVVNVLVDGLGAPLYCSTTCRKPPPFPSRANSHNHAKQN